MPRPEIAPPVDVDELVTKGYVLETVSPVMTFRIKNSVPVVDIEHQSVSAFNKDWLVRCLCFAHHKYSIDPILLQRFPIPLKRVVSGDLVASQ